MQGLGEILPISELKLTLLHHELFNWGTAQPKMYIIWNFYWNPNLSCGWKLVKEQKIPIKASDPRPSTRLLHTMMDDKSTAISHLLHTALPEVLKMRKSARPAFLLYIYEMDQIISKIKMHLALMLPRGSQGQARFSELLQLLTPTSKIPRERAAPAAQRMWGDYPKAVNANREEIPSFKKLCHQPLWVGTWKLGCWQRLE